MIEDSELDQILLDVFKGDEWLRLVDFVFSLANDFTDEERDRYTQLHRHLTLKNLNKDNPFNGLFLEITNTKLPL
ncbi:hypothetical protein ACN19N_16105 (plasmid) [Acinetobacter sp. LF10]|uniref:hypothetical protein n=1 Tax=unclassified Acinetobacter TaxID=196816 RepID=UPI0022AC4936|nr:hypothetical protein [Acinetobacter sp. TR3]